MPVEKIQFIDWAACRPAPYNRNGGAGTRSGFDDKSLTELAESIRQHATTEGVAGIIQPIILRPITGEKAAYEIVAGERRWTAAGRISRKLKIPALVRDYDETQAREVNAIENLQRVGLHFLEEAQGYQDLLNLTGLAEPYTPERIAQAVGKSPAFVHARLKLLRVPPLARAACLSNKMNHSLALLVARIPDPKLATKATIELLAPLHRTEEAALDPEVEPMANRPAREHIRTQYMVRLKDAPFDPEDAQLVPESWSVSDGSTEVLATNDDGDGPLIPKDRRAYWSDGDSGHRVWEGAPGGTKHVQLAGPMSKANAEALTQLITGGQPLTVSRLHGGTCSTCPFRSGNLKAMFPDVGSDDVCTNPTCFKKKKEADFKRAAARAKEEGVTMLKDREAASLFEQGRLRETGTGFVDLANPFPGKAKKTWREVLDTCPNQAWQEQLVQARDDQTPPQIHLLLPVAVAYETAQATDAGEKLKSPPPVAAAPSEADTAAAEEERRTRVARAERAAIAILAALRSKLVKVKPDKKFLTFLLRPQISEAFCARHQLAGEKQTTRFLKKRTEAELRALLVEALFADHTVGWQGDLDARFTAACDHFKVDWKKINKSIKD